MLRGLQGMENFNENIFARKQKWEHGGGLKLKFSILFYGDNSPRFALSYE
jgi:hypothetical protein